ncbi:hypothetical protein D0Z07_0410 [Hyphodiscus hymeniophilus]|uniref:Uncharacterized protein n=1 Tax=Hyphodiscus hymeniophilus TaxID=353542 RepID=A0A9P6VRJ4_9HELO|nr:hypothetical protein D0Z07_0410 [Hyphodiscus hymeniophilus]
MAENSNPESRLTWEDLAPQPISPTTRTTWDFTPFLTAPAVKAKSREEGKVNLLNIPRTKIPSPLASNLSPRQVIDIHESLVGEGGGGGGDHGKEIWLSWKRAWDLWNNHYVEGRVNPVWVGEEWERREKAKEKWDRERDDRRRRKDREKVAKAGGHQPSDPNIDPLRPIREVRRPKPGLEKNPAVGGTHPHHGRAVRGPDAATDVPDVPDDTMVLGSGDEEHSDSEPPAEPNINPDNSSAGWFPMKTLEEYREPGEDSIDDNTWIDSIANTVWRPRRVGERTLRIDVDKDIEEFRKSELNDDGGVDCGRSPFPVLRPVTQYVRTDKGAFRKKKIWDGVVGTIFNMPTQPLEPRPETEDGRIQLIRDLFSDPIRDRAPEKLFPLDIRRVLKSAPELGKPKEICEKGETLVRDLALYPDRKHRDMKQDDPWWITDSQKLARDVPPRFHPPEKEDSTLGAQLPLDDQLWKEEAGRDLTLGAGYFVTNLHGGTLVVNGMDVKKGDVAGPLPAFAIIECPGGQTAFWFGIGGRHYGAGEEVVHVADKWKILRQQPGWEHVAEMAGDVWDVKIGDRKEREKTGEVEDDDEEWARYKRMRGSAKHSYEKAMDIRQPGRYGAVPAFANDDAELEWLFFQAEEKKRMLAVNQKVRSLLYPDRGWDGAPLQAELSHEIPAAEKHSQWEKKHRNQQFMLQREINEKVAKEKADRLTNDLQREKRRAKDYLQSVRKKRKKADESREAAAARQAARESALRDAQTEKQLRCKVGSIYLTDSATRAAMFGNSGLSPSQQLAAFQQWKQNEEDRLEHERVKANDYRRKAGQPEFPPSTEEERQTAEAVKKLAKQALRSQKQTRSVESARHVQQLARLEAARKAREAADRRMADDAARSARALADQRAREAKEARDAADRRKAEELFAQSLAQQRATQEEGERKRKAADQARGSAKRQADHAAVERKRNAEAAKKAQESADLQAKHEAERKCNAEVAKKAQELADRNAKHEAERIRRAEASRASDFAKQQAEQDASARRRSLRESIRQQPAEEAEAVESRRAEAAKKAQEELAKQHAEQAETDKSPTAQDAASAETFQGKLQGLIIQYYAAPEGPTKIQVAQAYHDLLQAPRTPAEAKSYKDWVSTLTLDEMSAIQQANKDTIDTIKGKGGRSGLKTTQLPRSVFQKKPPPPPIQTHTPPSQPTPPTGTSPPLTSKFSPPSTVDQGLARAMAENDEGGIEFQRAIAASLETYRIEAEESLQVRAASMNMTPDQWAQTQGFDNAANYLATQMKEAKDDTDVPAQPAAKRSSEPLTPDERIEQHLAYWKGQMKGAIMDSIEARALREGFSNGEAHARARKKESKDAWADEKLRKMKLTAENIPSMRHESEMDEGEMLWEAHLWREWVAKYLQVGDWKRRIKALPRFSRVLTNAAGELFAVV